MQGDGGFADAAFAGEDLGNGGLVGFVEVGLGVRMRRRIGVGGRVRAGCMYV